MADTEPVAHMVKGLVPRIAPLIDVVTRAGPDQVVQCIITCPYKAKNTEIKINYIHSAMSKFKIYRLNVTKVELT